MTQQYAVLALVMLVSVGLFFAIDAMSPLSPSMLTVGYGAVALNAFYWFAGPLLAGALTELTGVNAAWLRWGRLDHGRGPDAAVDRTDTSQRAAVRADHRRAD